VEMILRRTVLLTKRQVGGLIISPTRELARQTFTVASKLCQFCSLPEPLLLVGGAGGYRPVASDLESFSRLGSDIVVGTPGRVEDILSRYVDLQMNELECLVLDEADNLLNMGFEVTLTNILSRLPKMRRTGLFSATRSGTSASLCDVKRLMTRAGLRNPVFVNVAIAHTPVPSPVPESQELRKDRGSSKSTENELLKPEEQATPSSLTNYYIVAPLEEKISRLVNFLKEHRDEKIVVFFLTCAIVEFYGLALQQLLPSDEFIIELLHGKLSPKRREKTMERFRSVEIVSNESRKGERNQGGILLCTDVAARGLDVPDIKWTVQFDAPMDPSQYIHRVGRSARAGKIGSSLIFLTPKEESFIDFLKARKVPMLQISDKESCSTSRSTVMKLEEDVSEEEKNSVEGKIKIINVLPKIKNFVMKDRDLLEKGTKAFTSYIAAYKKMQCTFIFRFASVDLGRLATSFCLLRLPKMPELRDKVGKLNFKPAGPDIDIYAIKFKDKNREKARQRRLASELAAGGKNAKQIKAEQRLAAKLQRQKERREEAIQKGRNPNKKRGKQAQILDEWDELAKEERLHKKLKRGKITKEQYDILMYGDYTEKDEDIK